MTQQVIYYDDGSTVILESKPKVLTLPKGRKFGRLKHDHEIYGVSRPTKNGAANHVLGLPETVKASQPTFTPLTLPWQKFAVDLLSMARYGILYDQLNLTQKDVIKKAYRSLYIGFRAFTNRHGWDDGYADYINGVNTNSIPMEQETINTGGNVVELLSDEMGFAGGRVYKVRTLNAGTPRNPKNPPNVLEVNHIKTPWLVFRATNSQRVKVMQPKGSTQIWTGKWIEGIVEPFPQNSGFDVPGAFIGKADFNYIDARRIEVLPDGAPIPSPYRYLKEILR
jgi:hypothetical protein